VQAQSQSEVYKHSRRVGHLTAGPGCEVDRLGLVVRINDAPAPAVFHSLAEHYLKPDFGADAVRPKSANTVPIVETADA
jgi:hypothetical protein